MSDPFSSDEAFKACFISGLRHLLRAYPGDHSSRILVLANASINEELEREFSDSELADALSCCDRLYRESLNKGDALPLNPEDALLFSEVRKNGISFLRERETQNAGHLLKVFNTIRGMRPARMAGRRVESIFQPFDSGFNFLHPSMEKEWFWQGTLGGISFTAMFNKFPTASWHFLLLPDCRKGLPQILTEETHRAVSAFVRGAGCAELAVAYNSAGAFASVGHLHFQAILSRYEYPVTSPCWRFNGGTESYPVNCSVFRCQADAWNWIQALHDSDVAYNLVYTREAIYGFARLTQGHYQKATGMPDCAFSEMAGRIVFTDRVAFNKTGLPEIEQELMRISLRR